MTCSRMKMVRDETELPSPNWDCDMLILQGEEGMTVVLEKEMRSQNYLWKRCGLISGATIPIATARISHLNKRIIKARGKPRIK